MRRRRIQQLGVPLNAAAAKRIAPYLVFAGLFAFAAWRVRETANQTSWWPATTGTVTASHAAEDTNSDTSNWTVSIAYTYAVRGVTYQGNNLTGDVTPHRSEEDARAKVAQYPAGAAITVYYSPTVPSESIVERTTQNQTWPLLAGISIAATLLGAIDVVRRRNRHDGGDDGDD